MREWSQGESPGREESTEGSIQEEEDKQGGQMEDGEDVITDLDQAVMDEEDGDDDDEEVEKMVIQGGSASEFSQ